ncbi:MAG TPA: hypothetical protein VMU61_16000 [Candidatus Aquilonibacter sp.]|nr:hypothetical protein [Candidatus Aquilonibacter sp.]
MEVRLRPDFQLGAGGDEYRVINAFIPEKLESWLGEDEEEVTFFPFLVVLERAADSKRFYWLPYWHLVGRNARHGQYATFLDQAQFDSLVTQAQQTTLAPA